MNKVIAISGFPGSGKSSLVFELSRRVSGAYLDYDRYQKITDRPVEEISRWLREGSAYNELVIPALAEDLHCLKTGKSVIERGTDRKVAAREYIFFETPLGREHRPTGQYIDLVLWLDIPLDVALARNIKAFTTIFLARGSQEEYEHDLRWLDTYLANYIEHIRDMLLLQYERVGKTADIVINAGGRIDTMVAEALNKLKITRA